MAVLRPGKCKLAVSSDLLSSAGAVWDRSVASHLWVARPCCIVPLALALRQTFVLRKMKHTGGAPYALKGPVTDQGSLALHGQPSDQVTVVPGDLV